MKYVHYLEALTSYRHHFYSMHSRGTKKRVYTSSRKGKVPFSTS